MGTGPGGSRYREKRVNTSGARRRGRAAGPALPRVQATEGDSLRGRPKALNPGERMDERDG